MILLPPRSTRTYTRVPYTTLFRSPALRREPGFVVRGSSGAVFGTPQFQPDGRAVARRTGMPAGRAGALFHLATRDRILIAAATNSPACRSEEHTSELQSLMRISYAVFCLKKKTRPTTISHYYNIT